MKREPLLNQKMCVKALILVSELHVGLAFLSENQDIVITPFLIYTKLLLDVEVDFHL